MTDGITFTLDGREVEARPGETIWQVAQRQGTLIPHLCWLPEPGYRADGNCRACMVEIEGERVLAASCIRKPAAGMKVVTGSDRAKTARRMVTEFLEASGAEDDVLAYVRGSVSFPNAMVDRIVPATTPGTSDHVAELLGVRDGAPVRAEKFSMWVIEDDFPAGRPAWERGGAIMSRGKG